MSSEAEQTALRIYEILRSGLSADAPVRQGAEKALREAEEEPDFFASLVKIAIAPDDQADPEVRWLASVYGKNAVSRSWRRRVKQNQTTDEERFFVREQLLQGLGERHSIIATQLSVWISSVARMDFPSHWPNLTSDLADAIRGNDRNIMIHALVTLDMVLKQLASRRLISDRQALYRAAPSLFALLNDVLMVHLNILVRGMGTSDDLKHSFSVVVRCLKGLRRLVDHGCLKLEHLPQVPSVLAKILELPDVFMKGASGGTEIQLRLSLLAAKFVRVAHERHPLQFQPFLPIFMQLYYNLIVHFNSGVSCHRTAYHAAYFLRNATKCPLYEINGRTIMEHKAMAASNPAPPTEVSPEASRFIVLSFLNAERTDLLIEAMISKIFVLTQGEIETWSSDPETLIREEEAGEWATDNLRYECEELFKLLLIRDKKRVVPMILKLAESVPPDKPLLLDACYRAVGKTVDDMHGAFDFDTWLQGQLRAILEADCSPNLGNRIIQARTAWLVAQFVEQMTREARQIVNPLLLRLMTFMDKDRVIALTAAKSLQTLVTDLGFHAGDFGPLLEPCLSSCFQLIHTAEAFETKRDMLQTVTSLVVRCPAQHVAAVIDMIASSLPPLWEETGKVLVPGRHGIDGEVTENGNGFSGREVSSGGENLLRSCIVDLLQSMVRKAGAVAIMSETMRKIVFPVIGFAVDLSPGKGGVFMMGEGCELWSAVVAASTVYSDELRALFPQTARILGMDLDNLREVFQLLEGYVLLGGEQFIRENGDMLGKTLLRALEMARDRGCIAAVEILDIVIQMFPQDGVKLTGEILCAIFRKAVEGTASSVVTAGFMRTLARATVTNIVDTESLVLKGSDDACGELLDAIIEHVGVMYRLPKQKLAALALAGIVTRHCRNPKIQVRVPGVVNTLTQVLTEEAKRRNRFAERESTDVNDFENEVARYGEAAAGAAHGEDVGEQKAVLPEEERRRALKERDVVDTVELKNVCLEMLAAVKGAGEENYNMLLGKVDGTVLKQLDELVR